MCCILLYVLLFLSHRTNDYLVEKTASGRTRLNNATGKEAQLDGRYVDGITKLLEL